MHFAVTVLTFMGSAPALLFLALILWFIVNRQPAQQDKQAVGGIAGASTFALMLSVLAILVWIAHKFYPLRPYPLNWWHVSGALVLLALLVRSISRQSGSVFMGILLLVPLGFLSLTALAFFSPKTVSGILMVLAYTVYVVSARRRAIFLKNLPLASTTTASPEKSPNNNTHTPVDPLALELRLKSQEANEGADKYTRE